MKSIIMNKNCLLNTLTINKFVFSKPWLIVREENKEGENKEGAGDNKTDITDNDHDIEEQLKDKESISKADADKMFASMRRKYEGQVQKTVKELETLKKSKQLTDQERKKLQDRIEELNNQFLTKEQLAAKEREKLENVHKQTVQSLTTERDTWQNRYITSQINTAIVGEAVKAEAFSAEDLIALLGPKTRLAQETDEEGKLLDSFVPKVKFSDVDAEGKPVTLDLTVDQAIKRMKEMDKYQHLFKSTATGGIGANAGAGKGRAADIKDMSPEQYREWRKKQPYAKRK